MDSVVKILLSIVWLGMVPFCIGLSLERKNKEKENLAKSVLSGYFVMFALFEVLCVPAAFLRTSFSHLCLVYAGIVLLWTILSLLIKRMKNYGKHFWGDLFHMPFLWYVALILIAVQIGIYLVGMADIAVKESLLRTITALQSLGYHIPGKKIVNNLSLYQQL